MGNITVQGERLNDVFWSVVLRKSFSRVFGVKWNMRRILTVVKSLAVGVASVVASIFLVAAGMSTYFYFVFQRKAPPGMEIGWDPITLMHGWGFSTLGIEFVFLGSPLLLFLGSFAWAYRRFSRRSHHVSDM